jgi:hypothetical protein
MNQSGIRVANRAGLQAQGVLTDKLEPALPQRPVWPFTVRRPEKYAVSAGSADKPSPDFKT